MGSIDRRSYNCKFHPFRRTDVTKENLTGIDTKADKHWKTFQLLGPLPIKLIHLLNHAKGSLNRLLGRVLKFDQAAEHSHDGVTDIFVQGTMVLEDNVRHLRKVLVQDRHEPVRWLRLGQTREIPDIGYQYGNLFPVATQVNVDLFMDDVVDDLGGDITSQVGPNKLLLLHLFGQPYILEGDGSLIGESLEKVYILRGVEMT